MRSGRSLSLKTVFLIVIACLLIKALWPLLLVSGIFFLAATLPLALLVWVLIALRDRFRLGYGWLARAFPKLR